MATMIVPSISKPPANPGIIFHGASWDDYEMMLRIVGERRIFVNYDRGIMEVMVPSRPHEQIADALGHMVDILCEELDLACEAGGSTTHRRPDLGRGVEPDRCFWLHEKAAAMIGRRELDLTKDPAPSLVIEVNYTNSSLDRMSIYAALGVDEVWRFDESLEFLGLDGEGSYRPTDPSRNFPMLTTAMAVRFLELSRSMERIAWMKAFRRFVREEYLPPPRQNPAGEGQP
jgi:Uma2 family endonuclease